MISDHQRCERSLAAVIGLQQDGPTPTTSGGGCGLDPELDLDGSADLNGPMRRDCASPRVTFWGAAQHEMLGCKQNEQNQEGYKPVPW